VRVVKGIYSGILYLVDRTETAASNKRRAAERARWGSKKMRTKGVFRHRDNETLGSRGCLKETEIKKEKTKTCPDL